MPEGLLLLKWNERSGIEIIDQYPKAIESRISSKTLLHIYNMHQYSRKKGVAWLNLESVNFISYYSGPELNYFFVLLLNMLEDPEDYEKKVEEYAKKIIQNAIHNKEKENFTSKIISEFELS